MLSLFMPPAWVDGSNPSMDPNSVACVSGLQVQALTGAGQVH